MCIMGTGTNDDSGFNATCALAWADALKAPVGQTVSRSVTGDNNRTVNIVQNQAGLGAKVFSVGYGVDTSDYASPDTEDVQYYFSANQAGQIANIFKLIQQTIVDSMAASNVVVRDIVTDDFDIVTPAGEVAVDGQDIPSGQSVTINGRTVTVPLGAITSSETDRLITITFRIKLRGGPVPGGRDLRGAHQYECSGHLPAERCRSASGVRGPLRHHPGGRR